MLAFWKGIGPAWMREASYTSLRLGLYGPLKTAFGVHKDSHFVVKFAVGSLAGAIGSIAGNPFDVLKTRMMTAEGKAPPSMRGAASDLYAHRGLAGFYRGLEVREPIQWHDRATQGVWLWSCCFESQEIFLPRAANAPFHLHLPGPLRSLYIRFPAPSPHPRLLSRCLQANIMRAMVLNGTKMACYDQIKGAIKEGGVVPKGLLTDFTAAFSAGFFMACTGESQPKGQLLQRSVPLLTCPGARVSPFQTAPRAPPSPLRDPLPSHVACCRLILAPPAAASPLLITATCSCPVISLSAVAPFDMVRTRLMNQPADARLYTGFMDCAVKILKTSGPRGLYAGFIPIWARFAPTTTLQLVIFEQIKPVFGVTGSGE